MASLPSPTKVSGKHNAIYEAYYKQVDPKGVGTIGAMEAAKFLKKSGLSDVVLSRIWDLADPKGHGCLDKAGFFVSLKLVALAQAGNTINMKNILNEPPNPPKVGELPKILPPKIQQVPIAGHDWTIKPNERNKYEKLFESLTPVGGLIAGNKVKGVLMESKLPIDTLEKIWDLADQDKDGSLDRHEFIIAMHFVTLAINKHLIPQTLPPEMQKIKPPVPPQPVIDSFGGDGGFVANFPADIAPPPPVPPLPSSVVPRLPSSIPIVPLAPISLGAPLSAANDWVVTSADCVRFEKIFRESDRDLDGLVSGLEVKDIFLHTGVEQHCLAHIWALCDTHQSGKLNLDQFALAMWMVERKKVGIEPPDALAPNMIPPSLRGTSGGIDLAVAPVALAPSQPTYANPELEMISKEIDEISRERRILENDMAQKDADIRIKSGEVRSLQSELDTLTATLKQLENQRGEAQKRLDDLKTQVNKIREQCQQQEYTINEQETELNSKRSELQKLKDEENSLEKEYDAKRYELDSLSRQLQDTQLQISQVKTMVTLLLENQRRLTDCLLMCKAAVDSQDPSIVSDYSLNIETDLTEAKSVFEKKIEIKKEDTSGSSFEKNSSFSGDAFSSSDAFANNSNGFGHTSASDPFAGGSHGARTGGRQFDDSFANAPLPGGFDDSFGGSGSLGLRTGQQKIDPFGGSGAGSAVTPEPGKDDFGSDPFAILHAPTSASQMLGSAVGQKSSGGGPPPRPESPSPALPPKKAKQPPPRPAPPRPLQGPSRPAPPVDGFSATSSGGFADFADFDQQAPPLPLPVLQSSVAQLKSQPSHITSSVKVPSTINNKLKNTPSTAANASGIVVTPAASVETNKTTASKKPIEFTDDPFKDYRYEDPFSIKDPFDDNDNEASDNHHLNDPLNNSNNFFKDNSNLKNIYNSVKSDVENNFSDSDAFTSSATIKNPSIFFDAFNDSLETEIKIKANNQTKAFDPFLDTANEKNQTIKTTKNFNNNFEDEFNKLSFDDIVSNDTNKSIVFTDFAKFDSFGDTRFDGDGKTEDSQVKNNKKPTKEIYSKTDNFDADLEEAIKRSVVDQ